VLSETHIALECPYCSETIYESLSWFKKSYSTCPLCDKGLVADQFTKAVSNLEAAMDEHIEEMVNGQSHGGGCCGSKKSSCCCGA
jgi:hypothetical protein